MLKRVLVNIIFDKNSEIWDMQEMVTAKNFEFSATLYRPLWIYLYMILSEILAKSSRQNTNHGLIDQTDVAQAYLKIAWFQIAWVHFQATLVQNTRNSQV